MSTLKQRLDSTIVNLKVISKLEGQQRLIFKNKNVSMRNNYFIITPLVRGAAGESRKDVIDGLHDLLEDVNRLIDDYINSPELQTPNISKYDRDTAMTLIMSLNRLKIELPHLYDIDNKGLNSVIGTYNDYKDYPTSSNIEGVVENLKLAVRRLTIALEELMAKFGIDVMKIPSVSKDDSLP